MGVRLSFDGLVDYFRETLAHLPDKRTGKNSRHTVEDVGLGAFPVFHALVDALASTQQLDIFRFLDDQLDPLGWKRVAQLARNLLQVLFAL